MKFNVVLEPAEEGVFNVTVPALDGCFTQGETEDAALSNAKEAILCYLGGLEKLNLLPFIMLGEYIHVGKRTSFGLGKYSIHQEQ